MQFNAALQRCLKRLQRAHGKRKAREVAFADCGGAAINIAVVNLAAIGVVGPAVAGRHHITVGVQRNGFALVGFAVAPAYDQIGQRLQPIGLDLGLGHRVALDLKTKNLQQLGGAFRVGCVVARRGVGGHADEFLQKAQLFIKMGVNPGIKSVVVGH